MTTMRIYTLTLIASLLCAAGATAQQEERPKSIEDLLQQIADAPNTEDEHILADKDGAPITQDVPNHPGYRIAQIAYLEVSDNAASARTESVLINPDGHAVWEGRVPSIIPEEQIEAPAVGTDQAIIGAIETSQQVSITQYSIVRDRNAAIVDTYADVSGKLKFARYYVYQDKQLFLHVKPYDVPADAQARPITLEASK